MAPHLSREGITVLNGICNRNQSEASKTTQTIITTKIMKNNINLEEKNKKIALAPAKCDIRVRAETHLFQTEMPILPMAQMEITTCARSARLRPI